MGLQRAKKLILLDRIMESATGGVQVGIGLDVSRFFAGIDGGEKHFRLLTL